MRRWRRSVDSLWPSATSCKSEETGSAGDRDVVAAVGRRIVTKKRSRSRPRTLKKQEMRLVYKVISDTQLVFARPERVKYVELVRHAIETSATWAELRHAMPRDEYSKVMLLSSDDRGMPRPKGSDPFDYEAIRPCVGDGEYPPLLEREMFRGTLPIDMVEQYHSWTEGASAFDRLCLVDTKYLDDIRAELKRLKYRLTAAFEQQMFNGVLPKDIVQRYGQCEMDGPGQLVCTIDPKHLGEIKAELEQRGYRLIDGSDDESFYW